MVVGRLPVVEALLTQLLRDRKFGCLGAKFLQRFGLFLLGQFQPACGVAARQVGGMLNVGGNAQARAREAVFAHVTAPAHGVSVLQCVVDS